VGCRARGLHADGGTECVAPGARSGWKRRDAGLLVVGEAVAGQAIPVPLLRGAGGGCPYAEKSPRRPRRRPGLQALQALRHPVASGHRLSRKPAAGASRRPGRLSVGLNRRKPSSR